MTALSTPACFACGSVAAAGFAILFNVPPRLLLVATLGGGLAVATRSLITNGFEVAIAGHAFGWGPFGIEAGATIGALAAGAWSVIWARRLVTPSSVLSVPAVIPLVPGVFSYKALLNLVNINHVDPSQREAALVATFEFGLKAAIIVAGISLGVALPRMIDRHLLRERD